MDCIVIRLGTKTPVVFYVGDLAIKDFLKIDALKST